MLERTKYGIEFNPPQLTKESRGLSWTLFALALIASVSLFFVLRARHAAKAREQVQILASASLAKPPAPTTGKVIDTTKKDRPPPEAVPPAALAKAAEIQRRPIKVRNLLMRLEEAERLHDIDMCISTIEQIRGLPGNPAADLDDPLARRLGVLNMRQLFERKSAKWTKEIVLRRGDSVDRLAREHGSTSASLEKLNGGSSSLRAGETLRVLNHPRFNLVIHRRTRTADLSLNGKFFKRYYLTAPVTGETGAYELSGRTKTFWAARGAAFKAADKSELDMLLPKGVSVLVAEY